MDRIKLKIYQERLLDRRREILSTLDRLEEETREVSDEKYFDWVDQGWEQTENRLLDQLTDNYRRELGRIEMALGRMLAGVYGLCLACRRPIPERRLDIFPATEFCSECQEVREEFERV
jgi:RNA polymerase-binding transcription factor DksA